LSSSSGGVSVGLNKGVGVEGVREGVGVGVGWGVIRQESEEAILNESSWPCQNREENRAKRNKKMLRLKKVKKIVSIAALELWPELTPDQEQMESPFR
jgi:hypothetical protein